MNIRKFPGRFCDHPIYPVCRLFLAIAVTGMFTQQQTSASNALPACLTGLQTQATVTRVINAHTIETSRGGIIRLAGIKPPDAGLEGRKKNNLDTRARKLLMRMILEKPVILAFNQSKPDRYGRRGAHVFVSSHSKNTNSWVQAEMIKQGLARAFPYTREASCQPQLLKIERKARLNNSGLWKMPAYQVLKADNVKDLNRFLGRLRLVEGRVVAVSVHRNIIYINFSRNWTRDFTVTLNRRMQKIFAGRGINIKELAGKNIRVRGWLDSHNGPAIRVYHASQIEVLKN